MGWAKVTNKKISVSYLILVAWLALWSTIHNANISQ